MTEMFCKRRNLPYRSLAALASCSRCLAMRLASSFRAISLSSSARRSAGTSTPDRSRVSNSAISSSMAPAPAPAEAAFAAGGWSSGTFVRSSARSRFDNLGRRGNGNHIFPLRIPRPLFLVRKRCSVVERRFRLAGRRRYRTLSRDSWVTSEQGEESLERPRKRKNFFFKSTRVTSGNLRMTLAVDFSIKADSACTSHFFSWDEAELCISECDPHFRIFSEKDKACS